MYTCNCQPIVVVQVNETIMHSIVTDPETDYIFVSDFDKLNKRLDDIINQALYCTAPTSTPSTSITLTHKLIGESTLQFLHNFLGFT